MKTWFPMMAQHEQLKADLEFSDNSSQGSRMRKGRENSEFKRANTELVRRDASMLIEIQQYTNRQEGGLAPDHVLSLKHAILAKNKEQLMKTYNESKIKLRKNREEKADELVAPAETKKQEVEQEPKRKSLEQKV